GLPPDDTTAIRELERLREAGATFLIFLWPAFWWFGYYAEFQQYLRATFRCILQNDHMVIFDLSSTELQSDDGPRGIYEERGCGAKVSWADRYRQSNLPRD